MSEFERRLARNPNDLDGYLVYADWLQQRGDPRGELIAIQHAQLGVEPGSDVAAQLLEREAAWFAVHGSRALGAFARDPYLECVELDWRCGFIDHVEFDLNRNRELDGAALVHELYGLPAARLISSFHCRGHRSSPVTEALNEVAKRRPLDAMRTLALGVEWFDARSFPECGELRELLVELPQLEDLSFGGLDCQLARLELPKELRRLSVCGPVVAIDIQAIHTAGLERLERLELSLLSSSEFPVAPDFPPPVLDVWRLLGGEGLPALRELEISGPIEADTLAALMVDYELAPTLRVLSLGILSEVGVEHLVAAADQHPQLEQLGIHMRRYPSGVFQRLVDAWGPERVRTPRPHERRWLG